MEAAVRASLLLFSIGALNVPVECCERPFVDVGGKCLYFEHQKTLTYFESFELCQFLDSRLGRITTAAQLKEIVNFIQQNDTIGHTYWLGGTDEYSEDTWLYAYEVPVPRGTPFWATIQPPTSTAQPSTTQPYTTQTTTTHVTSTISPFQGQQLSDNNASTTQPSTTQPSATQPPSFEWQQLPDYNEATNCLALNKDLHYYFTDEDCSETFSPICEKELTYASEQSDRSLNCLDSSEKVISSDIIIDDMVGTIGIFSSNGIGILPHTDTWTVSIDPRVVTDESYLNVEFILFNFDDQIEPMAYLSIGDGPDENSAELAKWVGVEGQDQNINSNGSQLYFEYFRGDSGSTHLLDFIWKAENTQCGKDYVGTNGMISSVNYDGKYLGNLDCEWTIQSPPELTMPNTIVQFTILHFDTQLDYDYLEIRDGNITGPILANLSGHSWPQGQMTSTGSQIYLHFHANDDLTTYTGFELQWQTVVCQQPYIVVGELCVHFTMEQYTWSEASIVCDQIGGHLAKINDPEHLRTMYSYLNENDLEIDSFWIGGKGNNTDGSWLWQDTTKVPMGTPFWGLTGDGRNQEPDDQDSENCLVLLGEGFHYFRDAKCVLSYQSICMKDFIQY